MQCVAWAYILEYYVRTLPLPQHSQSPIVAVWLHSHGQQLWLSHTVNNCGFGFLFFLSFVRVTWEKVAKEFETRAISYILQVTQSHKLELQVNFFNQLKFYVKVLQKQVSKKWYIIKYFLNSDKTLITSKNNGIWLFLPSNNGCTFCFWKKKKKTQDMNWESCMCIGCSFPACWRD